MARRVCLMAVANDFLEQILARMPSAYTITGRQECFDRAVTVLRLEGAALPDWCDEPAHGGSYVWAAAAIGGDGVLRLVNAGYANVTGAGIHQRIQEDYGHRN